MDYTDIYGLLAYLAEKKEPGVYDLEDNDSLEDFVYDYYMIDVDSFSNLINDLLPLCDKDESPLTGTLYQGFGTDNVWLVKKEVK